MTIGAIILIIVGVVVLIIGVAMAMAFFGGGETGEGVVTLILALIIAAALIISPIVYMNTETGKRALKDQKSNFGDGIERVVKVYDVSGELIEQYEGKFDIETSNSNGTPYILFDDDKGKRHIIYYTTGTIIVDEK